MGRGAQNLVLLLTGLAVVLIVLNGDYLRYVKPGLMPWLVASAVVLMALGAVSIIRDLRLQPWGEASAPAGHEGHSHRTWLAWVLVIPIAVLAFVVPPPLDAAGASPSQAAVAPPKRAFPPLPPGAAPVVSIPELMMRAAADSTNSLDGRTVTVTGFTLKRPDGVDLGRVVIVCCAADAQLARVRLTGAAASAVAAYPDDTWARVLGVVVPGSADAGNGFVPTLVAASATRVDKPANTYAY
jgi:putative membrane protein